MDVRKGEYDGVPQNVLRQLAWKFELGERVNLEIAAEHVHGAEAIRFRAYRRSAR